MSEPKDFLGNPLLSVFGMSEFERAVKTIIEWLASDATLKLNPWQVGYDVGTGWEKKFAIDTFPGIDASLFAMLCACGWISADFFPKYSFTLSKGAVKRLEASICQHHNVISYTAGDPYEECRDCKGYRVLRDGLWRYEGGAVQFPQPTQGGLPNGRMTEHWEIAGPMKFKITPSGLP